MRGRVAEKAHAREKLRLPRDWGGLPGSPPWRVTSGVPSHLVSSTVGIEATCPFGKPFPDVADVPGWRDYELPELQDRR
jgi:hypothetical protein